MSPVTDCAGGFHHVSTCSAANSLHTTELSPPMERTFGILETIIEMESPSVLHWTVDVINEKGGSTQVRQVGIGSG